MLGADLHFLELAQRPQAHVEDGFRLDVGELEGPHELGLRLVLLADDADHLVEVQVGDQIAAEHFEPVGDLGEAVVRPADQYVAAMVEPLAKNVGEAVHHRHPARAQDVHVEREPVLQIGELEQRFHQQRRIDGAALRLEHDADVFRRFVMDVGEQRQLARRQQLGDLLDQPALGHQIRDLGDDRDPGAPALILRMPLGADPERAAAGAIAFDDGLVALDEHAAGREIRPFDFLYKGFDRRIGKLNHMQRGVAQLGGVVRRDRGGHAHRDARGAVGQQVREGTGQDDRLAFLAVVGLAEIDGVLVDAVEQKLGDGGEPRLGVAHRRGVIAVDIAKIALPLDERIAHREILGQTHHRVVDRLIAVGVELTHDVADDAGALLEAGIRIKLQKPHREEKPPVHGLQPVAHIRQRTVHDRRQRIGQIALLERLAQVDRLDTAFGAALGRRRGRVFGHGYELAEAFESGKEFFAQRAL